MVASYGASVVLERLTVGPITEARVRASVNKAPMNGSLLGMSSSGAEILRGVEGPAGAALVRTTKTKLMAAD